MEWNKEATASFDVDPQRCFSPLCPGELPVPEGDLIVPELDSMAKLASRRIASRDAHSPSAVWIADAQHPQLSPVEGHKDCDVRWNAHAIVGTPGFEYLPGLDSSSYDFEVFKGILPDMHPYGACWHDLAGRRSTGAIEWLRANGIENVLVGGLALDFCVKSTALQLAAAGFRVAVNLAACRAVNPAWAQSAKREMSEAGVLLFADSASMEAELFGKPSAGPRSRKAGR